MQCEGAMIVVRIEFAPDCSEERRHRAGYTIETIAGVIAYSLGDGHVFLHPSSPADCERAITELLQIDGIQAAEVGESF